MARIVLTEAQFKDFTRKLLNEERKKEFTKKILKEAIEETDIYAEQSKREIAIFVSGLENGNGIVDDKCAAVPYPEEDEYKNDEPSRFIVYEFDNQGYLRDDGYSIQHIKIPGVVERQIRNLIYNNYGVTVPDQYA